MSTLTAAVNLDLITVKPYGKQLAFLLVGGAAVAVALRQPGAALPMAAVYATLFASYPFAVGDKADLAMLAGMLPVARRTIVLARYVFAVIACILGQVVGLACCAVIALASGTTIDPASTATLVGVSFALFAITAGIQLPLYLALGYARARLLGMVPFFAVFVLVGAVSSQLPDDASTPTWLVGAGAFAVGIATLAASCAVSVRIYERRQL